MPLVTRWEEPAVFFIYKGYRILRGYDDLDGGEPLFYHYAVLAEDQPDGVGFDVRDLPNAKQHSFDFCDADKHAVVIREAIDAGHLAPVQCDNCQWLGLTHELRLAKDLEQRLESGGEVPAGECGLCSALCYNLKRPPEAGEATVMVVPSEAGEAPVMVVPPAQMAIPQEDGKQLHLNLTEEGLVLDLVDADGEVIGSDCETYVEIAERLGLP